MGLGHYTYIPHQETSIAFFSRDPSQLIPEEHIHVALAAWGYQNYPIEKETN